MESDKADLDTQIEVDILMLDYLSCISIDTILLGSIVREESRVECDDWVLSSVHSKSTPRTGSEQRNRRNAKDNAELIWRTALRSILPENYPIPQDLQIKLQLLDFASIFLHGYTHLVSQRAPTAEIPRIQMQPEAPTTASGLSQQRPPSTPLHDPSHDRANKHLHRIIPEFMKLCTIAEGKVSGTRWVEIVAQFMMQAAAEEFHWGRQVPETFNLLRELDDRSRTLIWKQARAKYMRHLQSEKGMSLEAYFQATSNERVLRRLEGAVVGFLSDLVKTLDPPVLVQLERGQLGRLSRAETEQLKTRVGIR